MRPIAFAEASSVSLLFSRILIGAGAYAFDHSRKPYNEQDKTEIIQSAMSAARNMAVTAANRIVQPRSQNPRDNTREVLFPLSDANSRGSIQGMTLPPCRHAYEKWSLISLLMLVYGVEIWSNAFTILCRKVSIANHEHSMVGNVLWFDQSRHPHHILRGRQLRCQPQRWSKCLDRSEHRR